MTHNIVAFHEATVIIRPVVFSTNGLEDLRTDADSVVIAGTDAIAVFLLLKQISEHIL